MSKLNPSNMNTSTSKIRVAQLDQEKQLKFVRLARYQNDTLVHGTTDVGTSETKHHYANYAVFIRFRGVDSSHWPLVSRQGLFLDEDHVSPLEVRLLLRPLRAMLETCEEFLAPSLPELVRKELNLSHLFLE